MPELIELYHHGSSVCAAKVRMVLAEKGLNWTGHYLDILKGEQFDPAYLKLNPKGVVPTLVDNGEVIRESSLICEYLDDQYPAPPLKPATAADKVRMRYWPKFVDEYLHPACAVLTFSASHRHTINQMSGPEIDEYLARTPNPDLRKRKREWIELGFEGPEVVKAVMTFDKMLADIDAALTGQNWLVAGTFTLADISVLPYVNRLEGLNMLEYWQPERPRAAAWFERMKARPSFAPAIDDYLPEELKDDLRSNGTKSWPEVEAVLKAA